MSSGNPSAVPAGGAHAILDPFLYLPNLKSRRRHDALEEMLGAVRANEPGLPFHPLLRLLLDREALGSTAIGKGVALPHARSLSLSGAHLMFARSARGIDWEAPDSEPVHLVFLLLAPDSPPWHKRYLDLLARLAEAIKPARNRRRLLEADSFDRAAAVLKDLG